MRGSAPTFDDAFRAQLHDLFRWRRDVRRFCPTPVPPEVLAGLFDFAVYAEPDPAAGHGLGRRTMPETTTYSAVMAVHTLWLAARAIGLGLGWVSILDPEVIARVLDVPPQWVFVGYFCLGYPAAEFDTPELEREGWQQRQATASQMLNR